MCFPPTLVGECASEDVLDLFILDNEREEVEANLQLINGFFQIQIELLLPSLESTQITDSFENMHIQFQIDNAPQANFEALVALNESNPNLFTNDESYLLEFS